ncbi:hypothetical protein GCM10023203_22200 [Actinomycetospora straminea]|uniref:Uncharacterized protein n=2 Tax=Actinomycetospora straminea TaxID=663607 RepID=A0ABP9E8E8_9PSEU
MTRQLPCPGTPEFSLATASMHVDTSAALDVLVLTCRDGDCLAQWTPAPVERDGRLVIALSIEVCPACGSSTWEVTEVQVAGSPSAQVRRRRQNRRSHRSSHSGRGF